MAAIRLWSPATSAVLQSGYHSKVNSTIYTHTSMCSVYRLRFIDHSRQSFDFIAELCTILESLCPEMSAEAYDRLLSCVKLLVRPLELHTKNRDK